LQEGTSDARSADIHRVKGSVTNWLNEQIDDPSLHLNQESCNGHGLQSDVTRRLLCSISLDWDDPTVKIWNFKDKEHYFGKDFYPRCLYLGENGDPRRVQEGYLKSELLVKTFKVMFTLPSSVFQVSGLPAEPAERRHKKPKGSLPCQADNATMLNMNQVTLRSIAYAAVQVSLHFALQTASKWCNFYDDFSYKEFYDFIVDYFEADSSPEAKKAAGELLDWWNE
ncbi:hypothetical protein BDM02DRAFT_3103012, partial [Thelephora ganbajun]